MIVSCSLCNKSVTILDNLTVPQLKTQQYIQNYFKLNNKSPSYRNIQAGLGYKTPSAVYILVDALVQKQYLAKANYKKRSLIVLKEVPCEIS